MNIFRAFRNRLLGNVDSYPLTALEEATALYEAACIVYGLAVKIGSTDTELARKLIRIHQSLGDRHAAVLSNFIRRNGAC